MKTAILYFHMFCLCLFVSVYAEDSLNTSAFSNTEEILDNENRRSSLYLSAITSTPADYDDKEIHSTVKIIHKITLSEKSRTESMEDTLVENSLNSQTDSNLPVSSSNHSSFNSQTINIEKQNTTEMQRTNGFVNESTTPGIASATVDSQLIFTRSQLTSLAIDDSQQTTNNKQISFEFSSETITQKDTTTTTTTQSITEIKQESQEEIIKRKEERLTKVQPQPTTTDFQTTGLSDLNEIAESSSTVSNADSNTNRRFLSSLEVGEHVDTTTQINFNEGNLLAVSVESLATTNLFSDDLAHSTVKDVGGSSESVPIQSTEKLFITDSPVLDQEAISTVKEKDRVSPTIELFVSSSIEGLEERSTGEVFSEVQVTQSFSPETVLDEDKKSTQSTEIIEDNSELLQQSTNFAADQDKKSSVFPIDQTPSVTMKEMSTEFEKITLIPEVFLVTNEEDVISSSDASILIETTEADKAESLPTLKSEDSKEFSTENVPLPTESNSIISEIDEGTFQSSNVPNVTLDQSIIIEETKFKTTVDESDETTSDIGITTLFDGSIGKSDDAQLPNEDESITTENDKRVTSQSNLQSNATEITGEDDFPFETTTTSAEILEDETSTIAETSFSTANPLVTAVFPSSVSTEESEIPYENDSQSPPEEDDFFTKDNQSTLSGQDNFSNEQIIPLNTDDKSTDENKTNPITFTETLPTSFFISNQDESTIAIEDEQQSISTMPLDSFSLPETKSIEIDETSMEQISTTNYAPTQTPSTLAITSTDKIDYDTTQDASITTTTIDRQLLSTTEKVIIMSTTKPLPTTESTSTIIKISSTNQKATSTSSKMSTQQQVITTTTTKMVPSSIAISSSSSSSSSSSLSQQPNDEITTTTKKEQEIFTTTQLKEEKDTSTIIITDNIESTMEFQTTEKMITNLRTRQFVINGVHVLLIFLCAGLGAFVSVIILMAILHYRQRIQRRRMWRLNDFYRSKKSKCVLRKQKKIFTRKLSNCSTI